MAFGIGSSSLQVSDIYSKVTDMTLLMYYLNVNIIPCTINASYRIDRNPSLYINLSKDGKARFYDFATSESGDVIDLLSKTWHLPLSDVIQKIWNDIPKMQQNASYRKPQNVTKHTYSKHIMDLQVKFRPWKQYDLDFWESFGISLPWLQFGDIHPISRIFINKNNNQISFPADKLAYAYIERKDERPTMKIYQPYSKSYKWINNHNSSVWDLWAQLPNTGNQLIITSSRKDALCLWENTGIPSVSLQGEGYIPKEQVVQQLKNRFKEIYILYDNDYLSEVNHGRENSMNLCKKFNFIRLEIPEKYEAKDPSDFCKKYGREKLHQLIFNLIEQTKINPF